MSASTTLPTFPTTTEVLSSLQSALQALNPLLTNYNAGGATETYLEAGSLLIGSDASTYPGVTQKGAYELLTIVQAAEFILTATGNFLDLKAADVGVTRKPAVSATGPVQFTATVSSAEVIYIPAGTLVAAESADPTAMPIVYQTLTATSIPIGGTVSGIVIVSAINAGANGNQSVVGAINTVVGGATNVSVTSTQTIAGGSDTEGDDTPNGGLRARALNAIADASQCTISAIENAALSYAGIESAAATDINSDPTQPRGLVQLYVDDGSGNLGNASNANYAILATMQNDFNSGKYRAAGVTVNVQGSQLLPTTVNLVLAINATYATNVNSAANIVTAAQVAIYDYVNGLGIGHPVPIAEIIAQAAAIPGVSDVPVSAVTINGSPMNLVPSTTQAARIANLAGVTITFVLVTY